MRLLILFLIVKWGLITVYSIPTSSMEPTLSGGENWLTRDRVAIDKLAFGVRIPLTDKRLFRTGTPERWDIVVFDSLAPSEEGNVLVKRVVGLPGDTIHIDKGRLLVNGVEVELPAEIAHAIGYTDALESTPETLARLMIHFAKLRAVPRDLSRKPQEDFRELRSSLARLHDKVAELDQRKISREHAQQFCAEIGAGPRALVRTWWERRLYQIGPSRFGILTGPEYSIVPQGHYYCLGDNGPESFDSRMFGWVPHENLIGRTFAIVTPPDRMRDLSGFTNTPRGRLILSGSIALLVAWELIPGFFVFSTKLRGPNAALGLSRGDRILVDRIAYGPRIPFTTRRLFWWRWPREGDAVCYRMSRTGARDLYVGRVVATAAQPARIVVTGPARDGAGPGHYSLNPSDVLGLARLVWWPRGRRGRIRPAGAPGRNASGR